MKIVGELDNGRGEKAIGFNILTYVRIVYTISTLNSDKKFVFSLISKIILLGKYKNSTLWSHFGDTIKRC